ncbi:MAG: hypothetical protein IKA48_00375 [Fibrobacter sp.]|nr:hypothetical protein [Fibrobacter sp.]
MNYKGKELKEITAPQVFDPPKKMLVWDNVVECNEPRIQTVYAVIQKAAGTTEAIGECCRWSHCAEIPEESKTRRATNRELAKWLAQGNGEKLEGDNAIQAHCYIQYIANTEVNDRIKVRKWDDTEWHEPTVDYMDLEDKQVGANPIARYAVTDQYGNKYSARCTENGVKLFPTPLSDEKSDEIISAAIRQERIDGEREIAEAYLWNRACSDKNFFKEGEVEVGNQIWMGKNLDITDGGEGIYFNRDNCEYYYTWDAAKRIADKIPGWHLPSSEEWDELLAMVNAKSLMQEGYWGSRLDVKPTGYWNGTFIFGSTTTNFWSSSIDATCKSNAWRIYMSNTPYSSWESRLKSLGFSVRLVKDR